MLSACLTGDGCTGSKCKDAQWATCSTKGFKCYRISQYYWQCADKQPPVRASRALICTLSLEQLSRQAASAWCIVSQARTHHSATVCVMSGCSTDCQAPTTAMHAYCIRVCCTYL